MPTPKQPMPIMVEVRQVFPLAIRPTEAAKLIGLSKRELYRLAADDRSGFPKAKKLTPNCTVFDYAAVEAWMRIRLDR
jgi:predicted DNA-binding transcriptional regulator AlpA